MVNTKEFRVGNYVLVDGICQSICCIRNENSGQASCIGYEKNNNCEYEVCDSDRVQPVPVSNEILKKLGFVFHSHFKLWQRERPEKSYTIELTGDYDALDFSHNYIVRNCQHLHQLQNLFFSIQGKELLFDTSHTATSTLNAQNRPVLPSLTT